MYPIMLVRKQRLPQRGLIAYGAEHDGLDPFWPKGIEAILSAAPPMIPDRHGVFTWK
jgi:hypothetical protein